MKMCRLIAIAIATLVMQLPASAEVLGRWCDTPVPGFAAADSVISLSVDASGNYALFFVYGDGSSRTEKVRKDGSRYLTGNDFGEFYTTHANGRLSLSDSDGLIRTAMPTAATRPKQCR